MLCRERVFYLHVHHKTHLNVIASPEVCEFEMCGGPIWEVNVQQAICRASSGRYIGAALLIF